MSKSQGRGTWHSRGGHASQDQTSAGPAARIHETGHPQRLISFITLASVPACSQKHHRTHPLSIIPKWATEMISYQGSIDLRGARCNTTVPVLPACDQLSLLLYSRVNTKICFFFPFPPAQDGALLVGRKLGQSMLMKKTCPGRAVYCCCFFSSLTDNHSGTTKL